MQCSRTDTVVLGRSDTSELSLPAVTQREVKLLQVHFEIIGLAEIVKNKKQQQNISRGRDG